MTAYERNMISLSASIWGRYGARAMAKAKRLEYMAIIYHRTTFRGLTENVNDLTKGDVDKDEDDETSRSYAYVRHANKYLKN